MLTCGWTRNARERCQFAAGQGLATHKSSQNCRARGVPDQRRHFNHVCSGHPAFYRARRTFSKHDSSVRTEPKERQSEYRTEFARIVAGADERIQTEDGRNETSADPGRAILNVP